MPPVDPIDMTSNLGSGGGSYLPPSSVGGGSRAGQSAGAAPSKAKEEADSDEATLGTPSPASGGRATIQPGPPQGEERYLLGEELGRGGWGRVERARDKQFDRDVAVKRINRELAGASTIAERFFHEARVTGRLQHPGIVPVHELGLGEDGAPFYVMKLLEGVTFKETIRNAHAKPELLAGGFSVELLDRFSDICNAIAYSHQQGIIHRDLKPSNIMVGEFGETIVVDWGLAKQIELPVDDEPIDPDATLGSKFHTPTPQASLSVTGSQSNAVLGTPAYMSPEQSEGESGSLTPATDIYALGVILYEVLTGANPFRSKDIETTLSRVRAGQYKPPRAVNRRVPRALAAICTTAMARRREDRYERAEQIVEDLQRFLAGDSVSVYREPWWSHVLRWCRRRPALTAGVLGSVGVLTASSMIFGAIVHRAHQAELKARLAAEESRRQALERLADSREAGDAWLIDLSGSLQFFPGMNGLRGQLLEDATDHYGRLAAQLATSESNDNAAILESAKCHLRLGDLNRLREQPAEARHHYQQAAEELTNAEPGWKIRAEQANARIGLALLGDELDLTDDRAWLQTQLSNKQLSVEAVNQVANTYGRFALATVRSGATNGQEAIAMLFDAERAVEALVGRRREPRDHQLLQTVRDELAPRLQEAGQLDEAHALWRAEVERLKQLTDTHTKRPDLLQSLAFARMELAALDGLLQQEESAVDGYRSAIDDLREAWRLSDADSYYRRNVAASHTKLGRLVPDEVAATEHLNQAIDQLRQAVAVEGPSAGDLARLAECYESLGAIAAKRDEPEALDRFLAAEQCYEVLADHSHLSPRLLLRRLGNFGVIIDWELAHENREAAESYLTRAESFVSALLAQESSLSKSEASRLEQLQAHVQQSRAKCQQSNAESDPIR